MVVVGGSSSLHVTSPLPAVLLFLSFLFVFCILIIFFFCWVVVVLLQRLLPVWSNQLIMRRFYFEMIFVQSRNLYSSKSSLSNVGTSLKVTCIEASDFSDGVRV